MLETQEEPECIELCITGFQQCIRTAARLAAARTRRRESDRELEFVCKACRWMWSEAWNASKLSLSGPGACWCPENLPDAIVSSLAKFTYLTTLKERLCMQLAQVEHCGALQAA